MKKKMLNRLRSKSAGFLARQRGDEFEKKVVNAFIQRGLLNKF